MELVFYKSKEHKDYYLIYKGKNGVDPKVFLEKITHTGQHVNSGHYHAEIELGFVLKTDFDYKFFDYLIEYVATNHIHNPDYDNATFRSWYEFKEINNTDKWLNDFFDFQKQSLYELQKANGIGMQTALF